MKVSTCKSYDDLPLFLNAELLAQTLGISPTSAYELLHEKEFPTTDRQPPNRPQLAFSAL